MAVRVFLYPERCASVLVWVAERESSNELDCWVSMLSSSFFWPKTWRAMAQVGLHRAPPVVGRHRLDGRMHLFPCKTLPKAGKIACGNSMEGQVECLWRWGSFFMIAAKWLNMSSSFYSWLVMHVWPLCKYLLFVSPTFRLDMWEHDFFSQSSQKHRKTELHSPMRAYCAASRGLTKCGTFL